MNQKVKTKLEELRTLAQEESEPAVFVITHLLLARCLAGTQGDFAKNVCRVGSAISLSLSTEIEGGALPGEVPAVTLPDEPTVPAPEWTM